MESRSSEVKFADQPLDFLSHPERSAIFVDQFKEGHEVQSEAGEDGTFKCDQAISAEEQDTHEKTSHVDSHQVDWNLKEDVPARDHTLVIVFERSWEVSLDLFYEIVLAFLEHTFKEYLERDNDDGENNANVLQQVGCFVLVELHCKPKSFL